MPTNVQPLSETSAIILSSTKMNSAAVPFYAKFGRRYWSRRLFLKNYGGDVGLS